MKATAARTQMPNLRRKEFVRRVVQNESLDDIYSEDRRDKWNGFSREDQKKINESKVFVRFTVSAGLAIDPFDYENQDPPAPDIRTTIDGQSYYFELGEITDVGLARAVSMSEKTGEITGGGFSQSDPLLKMFQEKCRKRYETFGAPVNLLLYYSKQYPQEGLLFEYLRGYERWIMSLAKQGPFSRIWIYSDWPPQKVLWQILVRDN